MSQKALIEQITRLHEVVAKLRHPTDGCPWDLEQTHRSLLKYLIEESYEFSHAVEEENFEEMKDELGDILLQVVLHSQLASEKEHFKLDEVVKAIADKMVRRHPHVFADESDRSIEGIKKNWEKIKKAEKEKHRICFNRASCRDPRESGTVEATLNQLLVRHPFLSAEEELGNQFPGGKPPAASHSATSGTL